MRTKIRGISKPSHLINPRIETYSSSKESKEEFPTEYIDFRLNEINLAINCESRISAKSIILRPNVFVHALTKISMSGFPRTLSRGILSQILFKKSQPQIGCIRFYGSSAEKG
jgi:hypothetical protein